MSEIINDLLDYAEHKQTCICSPWRHGRPTKDGGYETLYGHGANEKWYQKGETPECTCGLDDIIKKIDALTPKGE